MNEIEQHIADELGVELCDHCGVPRLIHTGFDHGKGACLIDATGVWAIEMNGLLSKREKTKAISQIKEWDRRVSVALEAGSGI